MYNSPPEYASKPPLSYQVSFERPAILTTIAYCDPAVIEMPGVNVKSWNWRLPPRAPLNDVGVPRTAPAGKAPVRDWIATVPLPASMNEASETRSS